MEREEKKRRKQYLSRISCIPPPPSPTVDPASVVHIDERILFGVMPRRVLCVRMREWEIVVEVDWSLIVNPGSFSFFYGIIKTLCLLCHARKRGKERTSRVLITIKYVLSAYYFVYFITVTSLLMLLPLSSMIFFPFVIIINIIIIIIIIIIINIIIINIIIIIIIIIFTITYLYHCNYYNYNYRSHLRLGYTRTFPPPLPLPIFVRVPHRHPSLPPFDRHTIEQSVKTRAYILPFLYASLFLAGLEIRRFEKPTNRRPICV